MHILVCTTNFYPHSGGVERYCEELFSRVAAGGVKVTLVTVSDAQPAQEEYRGIEVYRLPVRLGFGNVEAIPDRRAWREFVAEARSMGITHVSTQTRFFYLSWLGARLARSLDVPHIHTEHGSGFVQHPSAVVRLGTRFVDYTTGRSVLRSATSITAVSHDVAAFVKHLSGREAHVVHNGIDLEFWDPTKAAALNAELRQWLAQRIPVLFMGRIVRAKGWAVLLDAYKLLSPEAREKIAILIAGAGPEEQLVIDALSDQEMAAGVRFLGQQTKEDIRSILAQGIYVNPSYSAEGLQTTLLEAAAMNSWIISCDVSAVTEVVLPEIGEVVPRQNPAALAAALERAAQHHDSKRTVGRQLMQDSFAWPKVVDQYAQIIINTS
jgi:glycosyltransferase involved in cell wall biosynthesis